MAPIRELHQMCRVVSLMSLGCHQPCPRVQHICAIITLITVLHIITSSHIKVQ